MVNKKLSLHNPFNTAVTWSLSHILKEQKVHIRKKLWWILFPYSHKLCKSSNQITTHTVLPLPLAPSVPRYSHRWIRQWSLQACDANRWSEGDFVWRHRGVIRFQRVSRLSNRNLPVAAVTANLTHNPVSLDIDNGPAVIQSLISFFYIYAVIIFCNLLHISQSWAFYMRE